VRPGRVLSDAVRQPTGPFRQTAPEAAFFTYRLVASHRATLLRPAGRQNAHRDTHPRHAPIRFQFQLALHAVDVNIILLFFLPVRGVGFELRKCFCCPPTTAKDTLPPLSLTISTTFDI